MSAPRIRTKRKNPILTNASTRDVPRVRKIGGIGIFDAAEYRYRCRKYLFLRRFIRKLAANQSVHRERHMTGRNKRHVPAKSPASEMLFP